MLREWIEGTLHGLLSEMNPSVRVLDVGCGGQPFRRVIESLGACYFAMDVEQNEDDSVDFVAAIDGPVPEAILAGGPYSLILCTEVLEHVADWQAAFASFVRLLAPGGVVVLTCPHFYQLHEEPYDYFRATTYAIETHAERAGLLVDRVERLGNAWDVLGGVLANINVSAVRRDVISRGLSYLARLVLRQVLFALLRRRWFHNRFDANSKLYLANAAIVRKP